MANCVGMQSQITGGILTGGLARRFQSEGSNHIDKGLLDLHGQPLVAHTAQKLQPYTTSPLLISANRNKNEYKQYGEVIVDPDYLEGYQGPLAGVLAMLGGLSAGWLMVLPVDSPFLPTGLLEGLWQAHLDQPEKQAFFVQHKRTYPLCLLIHKDSAPALKKYLLAGQRRVQGWLAEYGAVAVDMQHYPVEVFFNINEPADLQRARQLKTPNV